MIPKKISDIFKSRAEKPEKKTYAGMVTFCRAKDSSDPDYNPKQYRLSGISKDGIIELLMPVLERIYNDKLILSPLTPKAYKGIKPFFKNHLEMRKLLKEELAGLYAAFANDLSNVKGIATVDEKYAEAWKLILNSYKVTEEDFKEVYGRKIDSERYQSWGLQLIPESLFFPVDMSAYTLSRFESAYKYRYSVSQHVRRRLTTLLYGQDALSPILKISIESKGNQRTDDFEKEIQADLMVLSGMALQGSMLNANGTVAVTALRTLKKQSEVKEFAPVLYDGALDRAELLALTYFAMMEHQERGKVNSEITVKSFAKFVVDKMPRMVVGTRFGTFLPTFQGFNKAWASTSYVAELTGMVAEIVKSGGEMWQSMENFRRRILCNPDEGRLAVLKLFSHDAQMKSKLMRRSEKDMVQSKVKSVDWFEEVGFKFIINWLKYLCGVGLVDLIVDKDIEARPGSDPLDGIRYMKLTPLGLYAFGLQEDYVETVTEIDTGVEYDSENGIITVASITSPYVMFLSSVSQKISPTRFKISEKTLLKDCRNKAELNKKIQSLNSVINIADNPSLKKIATEALNRTDCMEREEGYSLLRIRKYVPEISRLISTDPKLRKIAHSVSRGMVMVKTVNLDKFYEACASEGYLVD